MIVKTGCGTDGSFYSTIYCPGGHSGGRGAEPDHRDAAPEGRLEAGHRRPRPGHRQEGGQSFMVLMSQHFARLSKLFAQNLIKHTI